MLVNLDSFALENNLNIGFIKTDVESHGLECLRSMVKTIQRDCPVLCLSIYHNLKEFFEMKPLLDEITINMDYKITLEKYDPAALRPSDMVLFAYPKELDDVN